MVSRKLVLKVDIRYKPYPMRVGRYYIESILSKNGMGEVYLANLRGDAGFNKRVVIKLAKPELARSEKLRGQFIREATLSAQLSHQNLVQVFDFGFENGRPYLVMEYVEGFNLRELINEEVNFSDTMTVSLLYQVLLGLEEAFQKNIVHRDLTPSNILVNKFGVVKIADFGLAKFENEPQTGEVWGKLSYIAPEIINGESADHKSDLYSLGKIGEELLKGSDSKLSVLISSLLLPRGERPSNTYALVQSLKDFEGDGSSELAQTVLALLLKRGQRPGEMVRSPENTGKIVNGRKYLRLSAACFFYVALLLSTGSVDKFVVAQEGKITSVLNLNVVPWAYVYVNDVYWGETPIVGKRLSAGNYRVVFTNPTLRQSKEFRVELPSGKEENVFYSFPVSKKMNN